MSSETTPTRDQIHEERVLSQGKWITESFLENLIRESKQDNLKIIEKDVSPAVPVGNNYLSTLFRVKVKYVENGSEKKEKSLIIKAYPSAPLTAKMADDLGVFEIELYMYNEVLPKMRRILSQYTDEEFFAPVSYKCEIPNTLCMEDLNLLGYKMADRRNLLDFDHLSSALKSLARFHALSLALKEREPETYQAMSKWEGWMNEKTRESMTPWIKVELETHIQYLRKHGSKYKRFIEMLEKYLENAFDNMIGFASHKTPGFIDVLCHGDTWLTNMLFKYNSQNKVSNVTLVDYQICRLGSPAFDILHFLFTSSKPEVLSESMYKLLAIYHEALVTDAQTIGIEQKIFTLNEFLLEMRRKCGFAIVSIFMMFPNILLENEDVIDMDKLDVDCTEFKDEDNPVIKMYDSPKRWALYQKLLKHYEDCGYIESSQAAMI